MIGRGDGDDPGTVAPRRSSSEWIRQEILDWQKGEQERRLSSSQWFLTEQRGSLTSSASSSMLGTGFPSGPPRLVPPEDFAQEEDSSATGGDDGKEVKRIVPRALAWLLGLGFVVALGFGIAALVEFCKENRIQLRPTTTTAAVGTDALRVVSLNELAAHSTPEDCWVSYHSQGTDYFLLSWNGGFKLS